MRSLTSSDVQLSFCSRSCSNLSFCSFESLDGLPPANRGINPLYPSSFHLSCQIYPTGFFTPTKSHASSTLFPLYLCLIKYKRFSTLVLTSKVFILLSSSSTGICFIIWICSG